MSSLTFLIKALAYDDLPPTNNPTKRGIDRSLTTANIPVENDGMTPVSLDPFGTATLFDSSRTLGSNGSTAYDLTLSTIDPTVYRLTWTGVGAAPAFRVDRAVDTTGILLTLEVQTNSTLKVTAGSGTPFSAVLVGDVVFVPGASTGDPAGPFSALNEGYWTVLSATSTVLVLSRDPSAVFSGASEAVTPAAAYDFQAFSTAGVQAGDTVDLTAGFSALTLRSYEVTAVNPAWIEFRSTAPLGEEEDVVPGASGVSVYTMAKRFVLIESDQEIVVRFNADTSNNNRMEPWLAGSDGIIGTQHKVGPTYKLVLVNRSSVTAHVKVSSAE